MGQTTYAYRGDTGSRPWSTRLVDSNPYGSSSLGPDQPTIWSLRGGASDGGLGPEGTRTYMIPFSRGPSEPAGRVGPISGSCSDTRRQTLAGGCILS